MATPLPTRLAHATRSRLPRSRRGVGPPRERRPRRARRPRAWSRSSSSRCSRTPHGYGRHDWDADGVAPVPRPEGHPAASTSFPSGTRTRAAGTRRGAGSRATPSSSRRGCRRTSRCPCRSRCASRSSPRRCWGAIGAWLLASRFTRSHAARAFVAVVFAVNGRWTLQLAAGHAWHMVYAWMPWALFLFDRAVGRAAGARPAAHARRRLGGRLPRDDGLHGRHLPAAADRGRPGRRYALLVAIATRSARPLRRARGGRCGLGRPLRAQAPAHPRGHAPRTRGPSTRRESLTPEQLVELLTNREQGFAIGHAGIGTHVARGRDVPGLAGARAPRRGPGGGPRRRASRRSRRSGSSSSPSDSGASARGRRGRWRTACPSSARSTSVSLALPRAAAPRVRGGRRVRAGDAARRPGTCRAGGRRARRRRVDRPGRRHGGALSAREPLARTAGRKWPSRSAPSTPRRALPKDLEYQGSESGADHAVDGDGQHRDDRVQHVPRPSPTTAVSQASFPGYDGVRRASERTA